MSTSFPGRKSHSSITFSASFVKTFIFIFARKTDPTTPSFTILSDVNTTLGSPSTTVGLYGLFSIVDLILLFESLYNCGTEYKSSPYFSITPDSFPFLSTNLRVEIKNPAGIFSIISGSGFFLVRVGDVVSPHFRTSSCL